MAVKDTEPYLEECLDSILAQTFENWELLAVNDHSTDRSRDILESYAKKDPRIRVFDSKGHRLIPALQTAYENLKGELINRMDSDDRMPIYKLQLMIDEWHKHGRGHVIAGGTQHFVENGEVGDGFLRYDRWLNDIAKRNAYYEEIYRECVIPSHCWLIHKSDFEEAGGFDSLVYPEDYDLCFRFYKSKLKIIGLDTILHHWRDRSERISRTWDEYKDNRYFDIKVRFFYELDRDLSRPLVIWGAGKNGKDLAKLILTHEANFHWVCDSENKIGKDIYDIRMHHFNSISVLNNPQILVVVSSPDGRTEIEDILKQMGKEPIRDYWLFL
jgi:glycosyltransferase involved in cell wall biosynthesis